MRLSGHDASKLDVARRIWEKYWEKFQHFFWLVMKGNLAYT